MFTTGVNFFGTRTAVSGDPSYSYVTLLLHGDGANAGTTFTDNSNYIRTGVIVGSGVTTDTSVFKYGTASMKFTGAGRIDYGVTTNYQRGLQPFVQRSGETIYSTVECWFKTSTGTGTPRLISQEDGAFNNGSWLICMNTTYAGSINFYYRPFHFANPMMSTTVTSYADGNWHHVAVTYGGGTWTLWVDGISKATQSFTMSATLSTTNFSVGGGNFSGNYFTGWIDDLRITKADTSIGGTTSACRYTTAFTPPTAAFPNSVTSGQDQYWASVISLQTAEGTVGQTALIDNKTGFSWIQAGSAPTARLSSTQAKFGSTSIYFDGSTPAYQTVQNSTLFPQMNADFTMEVFFYPTDSTAIRDFFDCRSADTATPLNMGIASGGAFRYYDGSTVRTGSAVNMNAWNYAVWCRKGSLNYVYLNGTLQLMFSNAFSIGPSQFVLGTNANGTSEKWIGYIDEMRVTRDFARYPGSFTPPTEAFPNSAPSDPQFANVTLLVHADGANGGTTFTDSSSYNLTATRIGLATTDTTVFKYGTASLKLVAASSCGLTFPNSALVTGIFGDVTSHVRNSTLELWFKTSSTTVNQTIIAANNGAFNTGAWSLLMSNSYVGSVEFWLRDFSNVSPLLLTTTTTYNDGNWHHIAITKQQTYGFTMWIDGVLIATANPAGTLNSPTAALAIGFDTTYGRYFEGWLDDIRLTTSTTTTATCRYNPQVTVPTSAFPTA